MTELVRAHGTDTRTRERIVREAEAAKASLSPLPASPEREALQSLAALELERVA